MGSGVGDRVARAMTANIVDGVSPIIRKTLALFTRGATYQRGANGAPVAVPVSITGLRTDQVFGAAAQGDVFAELDVAAFEAAFGAGSTPAKFDRLRVQAKSYAVEEWRGAPNDAAPVVFKLLLRGGSQ
jgi:hypothetical protein